MKKILAITLVAMVAATSVQADAISINWTEFTGAVNLVADGSGVEPANNWNDTTGTTWNDQILSSGAASTIDIAATAPGGMDSFGFALQNYSRLRAGIVVYATPATVTLSDINATFATYDVIVYVTGFNGVGNQSATTVGGVTYYATVPNPYTTVLTQSTDTNIGDGADDGTYVRFNGLTADSTTITMASVTGAGVGIGGIQVVGTVIPEPATLGLLGAFGGGILFIRRKFKI